ncbi:MAG: hypothetical protein WBD58_09020 [Geitlerinemataceae cyanobacterium]
MRTVKTTTTETNRVAPIEENSPRIARRILAVPIRHGCSLPLLAIEKLFEGDRY